uniref:Uncharacterized protein n=1 Tax=Arundo donax TaxID=35708 RepID=A0A0A9CZ12_ARUDO
MSHLDCGKARLCSHRAGHDPPPCTCDQSHQLWLPAHKPTPPPQEEHPPPHSPSTRAPTEANNPKLGWITNPIQSTRRQGKCDWMPAVLGPLGGTTRVWWLPLAATERPNRLGELSCGADRNGASVPFPCRSGAPQIWEAGVGARRRGWVLGDKWPGSAREGARGDLGRRWLLEKSSFFPSRSGQAT